MVGMLHAASPLPSYTWRYPTLNTSNTYTTLTASNTSTWGT